MSSRSNDSQRLAYLAKQLADVAAGHVKMVGVLQQLAEQLQALDQKVADIDEALDQLERQLIKTDRCIDDRHIELERG